MTTLQKQHAPSPTAAGSASHERNGHGSGHDQPVAAAPLLRPHVISAIFSRNIANYFINPAGYVFITLFVLISAFVVFFQSEFFANNLANLDLLNDKMPILLLFFVPAITMSIWAEERKQGTDELLLTLPARDFEVVLGKYLAALGIYTVALGFALTLVVILAFLGRPDLGVMLATFLGYWLMGAMFIAIGMVASVLSSNTTVAFILGALFCAVPVFIGLTGLLFSDVSTRQSVENISVPMQFRDFGAGAISISSAFYFLSFAAMMLFLNTFLLGRRHWAGSRQSMEHWGHGLIQTLALVTALVSATLLIENLGWRLDATSEQLHSLSGESEEIVEAIPGDKEILIQAFYSPEVPREYIGVKNNVINLLKQFSAWGGNRVRLSLVETRPYSEEAAQASKLGIMPRPVVTTDESRRESDEIFLGVSFRSGAEEVILPFVDPGLPIEYELARSIRTVAGGKRKKVGVLSTDAQIMGGGGGMMGGGGEKWDFVAELERQYDVKSVSADSPINRSDVDVLIAPMPSTLSPEQMNNFRTFVASGGPTLILEDPLPLANPMLSPLLSKPSPNRGGMFGGQPPAQAKGDLQPLLDDLGIDWPRTSIVWNMNNPHPQISDGLPRELVFITANTNSESLKKNPERVGFNAKNPATAGFQEIVTLFGGRVVRRGKPGLEYVPLLTTSEASGTIDWNDAVTARFGGMGDMSAVEAVQMAQQMGIPSPLTIRPNREGFYQRGGTVYQLAAEIRPETKDSSKPHVIFVADMDMISNEFFSLRRESADSLRRRGLGNLILDNVGFVLNCVDQLAGDDTFLEMRKRRPKHRTLERLEAQTRAFEENAQKEISAAEAKAKETLTKAQTDLNKEAETVRKAEDMDSNAKNAKLRYLEEVANRRLAAKKDEIESETRARIEEVKTDREREVRQIQGRTKMLATLLPPLLPAILAVIVFLSRAGRENRGANPNRLA